MLRSLQLIVVALLHLAVGPAHAAEADTGIVLLHGKRDKPPTRVQPLARQLQGAGYRVATPDMPWSGLRDYDAAYPQALAQIEAAAQSLRDQGATRIVIVGQSFGGNGALAYAASGRAVDAIAVLSPGHTPERDAFRQAVAGSVDQARAMQSAGHGTDKAWFDDRNQGKARTVRTTADIYLSYFDPDGLGNMQLTAAKVPAGVPIFMAVGTADEMAGVAEASILRRAPPNDQSAYRSVTANHQGVVKVIGPELIAWLRGLW